MDHKKKNSLIRDATDAQRAQGLVPDVAAIDKWATDLLENLDAEKREAKPVARPKRKPKGEALSPGEVRRRIAAQDAAEAALTEDERKERDLAGRRIQLLAKLPDWEQKLRRAYANAMKVHMQEGRDFEDMLGFFITEVLNESNRLFGDWRREDNVPIVKP